jgi:3-hydroxyisobutyrate dehydrogenase-like beta-hydroxyacid dehydrogenase
MTTLGFIGTGGMGVGMAANLIKAGFSLVVHDRNRAQADALVAQGAEFMDSPRAVAESCDLVLSMLPHNDAVEAVSLGAGGLVEATRGAKTWIDFSSIDKETIVRVSDALVEKGWEVVDGSAGGVEEVAAAGQLALWLSGSRSVFDAYQPIFAAMGKSVLHVGELGNAKLVKNAMAMLAAVQHLSIVEVGCWLKKGGLDDATFQTIIKNSQQDSIATRRIMEIVVSGKYKPRKSWMPKDIGFGLDMAREMEVPMPFVSLASQMFAIAQATGQDGYEATGIACNVYDVLNGIKR